MLMPRMPRQLRAVDVLDEPVHAVVVEAHAVDERVRPAAAGTGAGADCRAAGRGVTVPISMKPKPSVASASMYSPFLSSPAASPTGFGKRESHHGARARRRAARGARASRELLQRLERTEREVVRGLRLQREERGAEEGVGHAAS